jgi:hypothetical protein
MLDVERVVVVVVTNAPDETAQMLREVLTDRCGVLPIRVRPSAVAFGGPSTAPREVQCIPWTPRRFQKHPYFLTWAHKGILRRALEDPSLSHFVYLEDDIGFSNASLSYWLRFREPLASHGLLPGFVRYERNGGSLYVVDQTARQSRRRASVRLGSDSVVGSSEGELTFVGLDNPHQGMYVLDRVLAHEHFRDSPARSHVRSRVLHGPNYSWSSGCIRERAAIGPMFDNVPFGFAARTVVPVKNWDDGEPLLDSSCLIEHVSGNYSAAPDSPFGSIRVEDLFL